MAEERERTEQWGEGPNESAGDEELDGLELAEVPTSPAHLGDEVAAPQMSAGTDQAKSSPARVAAEAATPPRRRRGGRPRVTAEQDQKIIEAFERAKEENRSLREVASQLAREFGQPADYINQRYYYLQRKARPEGAPAKGPGRRRGRPARASVQTPLPVSEVAGPAPSAAAPTGETGPRRGRRARGPAAPEAGPAAPVAPELAAISRSLSDLTEMTRTQLTGIVERLQKLETRLTSLEERPAVPDVPVDDIMERLGQLLQERSRAVRGRERLKSALQDFLKTLDENV